MRSSVCPDLWCLGSLNPTPTVAVTVNTLGEGLITLLALGGGFLYVV